MVSPTYRLKIKKIPLPNGIQYKEPRFPAFKELHLDLLENKTKLKKNPPKPLFVRRKDPPWLSPRKPSKDFETLTTDKDDLTLEELEKKYIHNNDHSSDSDDSDRDRKHRSSDRSDRSDKDRKHSSDHSSDDDDDDKKDGGGGGKKDDRDAKTSSASAGASSAAPDKYKQEDFDKQAEEEESEEEREQKEKANLLFKYAVLRKKYPNAVIPEFTEHSDMATMKRVYDQLMQKVSLDSNVETYKQYLQGGFMVMELVCTRLLNINMGGFARQQAQSMNRYEQLLVELGEKHYSTAGSRFPVELRLVFLIVFNAGLFYVQKMLFSGAGPTNGGGGGGGVMDFIGSMFGGGSNDNTASPTATTNMPSQRIVPNQSSAIRKTMSGPTITPKEVETYTSVPSASAMPMPTSKPMPMPTSSASMRLTAAATPKAATAKAASSKPMATPKPAVTMASASKKSDGHSSSSDFD